MKLVLAALILGLGTVAVAKEFRTSTPVHSANFPVPLCPPDGSDCHP